MHAHRSFSGGKGKDNATRPDERQLRGNNCAAWIVLCEVWKKAPKHFLRRKQNSRPLRTCWTALGIEWDAGTGVSQVSEQEVIIPFGQI